MATAPAAPPPPPKQSCRKCGCEDMITQLRKVVVDVGWKSTQIHAVAPCQMCTKCGNTVVIVNATVGELANLVPDPEFVAAQKKAAVAQAKALAKQNKMAAVQQKTGAAKRKGNKKKAPTKTKKARK